jgi:hypothetical protein
MEFKLSGRALYPHGFAFPDGDEVTPGEINRLIYHAVNSLKETGEPFTYIMTGNALVVAYLDIEEGIVVFVTDKFGIGWCDE